MKVKKLISVAVCALTLASLGTISASAQTDDVTASLRIEGVKDTFFYGNLTLKASEYSEPTVGDLLCFADESEDSLTITGADIGYITEVNGDKAGTYNPTKYDGWYYTVNGVSPDTGVSDCALSDNDVVVLYYGDYPCSVPKIDTSFFSADGTISFTADSTTYEYNEETGQWNSVTVTVPVTDMSVTLNGSLDYKTDENGKIKVDLLNAGFVSSSISLQVSKLSEYGAPAVLRYAPDFTIDAPDRSCDLYGDADSDGELSIRDVSLMQQYCAKISDLSAKAFISADVNCDCFVDINDVSLTQQALADLVKLPVA